MRSDQLRPGHQQSKGSINLYSKKAITIRDSSSSFNKTDRVQISFRILGIQCENTNVI